jgi:hypothetical protein
VTLPCNDATVYPLSHLAIFFIDREKSNRHRVIPRPSFFAIFFYRARRIERRNSRNPHVFIFAIPASLARANPHLGTGTREPRTARTSAG